MFLKYLLYCHRCLYGRTAYQSSPLVSSIEGLMPGLINHLRISVALRMYSGRRLGNLVYHLFSELKFMMTDIDAKVVQAFIEYNGIEPKDLDETSFLNLKKFQSQYLAFASIYPTWYLQAV